MGLDARGRERVQTINDEPSMTVQSDAHLADVRNILQSFGVNAKEILDEAALTFADVSEFTDFRDLMDQNRLAEEHFMKLPAQVRLIFDNDVAVFLDSSHDKEKRDALVEAGFIKRMEVAEKGSEGGTAGAETLPGTGNSSGTAADTAE